MRENSGDELAVVVIRQRARRARAHGCGHEQGGHGLGDADRRGLTPLFWSNINPHRRFRLDMDRRLDLETDAEEA